ncbi:MULTISPECIES: glycosyltransferase, partial [unclassified Arenibacter]|uniref:glycosyltransferase n=1 Tax=unclassified Arenibacter TaxID=2615047 RepID=UPI000E86540A
MKKQKIFVISGINIIDAGPLSIMKDFLKELSGFNNGSLKIIALVNSSQLFNIDNIEYYEFPKSKKNWLNRIYYEYIYFKKFSKKIKPDYWISMHDITPNIICENQYVYCHNATPYYTPTWKDWRYGSRASLFSLLYIYLYKINIRKNKGVIVQQEWLREKFKNRFNLDKIIVAYPKITNVPLGDNKQTSIKSEIKKIFFPSFPRSFKNFEVICEAYSILPKEYQNRLIIYLTLDENLNSYASYIINKYKYLEGLKFIGLLSRAQVYEYYKEMDGLVFPSKLESWGLPITEFKSFNK